MKTFQTLLLFLKHLAFPAGIVLAEFRLTILPKFLSLLKSDPDPRCGQSSMKCCLIVGLEKDVGLEL